MVGPISAADGRAAYTCLLKRRPCHRERNTHPPNNRNRTY
ncbi:hypothetical protein PpBr36_02847 [Pyricularia pennisetigena]|nr:hypothetical protein PpBr36_02847 [Pyricularia pennisetigena]TLS29917.1 hypothetical protein PpBr36_02847 [Pyricularia pennisetigena]